MSAERSTSAPGPDGPGSEPAEVRGADVIAYALRIVGSTAALAQSALLSGQPAEVIAAFRRVMETRRYEAREPIFLQGTAARGVYLIEDGRVKVTLLSPDGGEALIGIHGAGETLGQVGLAADATHPVSACAVDPSTVSFLARERFWEVAARFPALAQAATSALAATVENLVGEIGGLHFADARMRLAGRILRLAAPAASASRGALVVDWPYSQTEVAHMIGTTRQTAHRVLHALEDDGVIVYDGRTLRIPDLQRLRGEVGEG